MTETNTVGSGNLIGGKQYIGTKFIHANPMTSSDFEILQRKKLNRPTNEEGYIVQYPDGYISWSPKKAFEDAYTKNGEHGFGHALEALKQGKRVARAGWNGKNQFIFLEDRIPGIVPCLLINTGSAVVPWVPSQTDQLANDWEVVEA